MAWKGDGVGGPHLPSPSKVRQSSGQQSNRRNDVNAALLQFGYGAVGFGEANDDDGALCGGGAEGVHVFDVEVCRIGLGEDAGESAGIVDAGPVAQQGVGRRIEQARDSLVDARARLAGILNRASAAAKRGAMSACAPNMLSRVQPNTRSKTAPAFEVSA